MKNIAGILAIFLATSVQFLWAFGDVYNNYYTHYTNASGQLWLNLSPAEAVYWDGSSVNLQIGGGGFNAPLSSSPGAANLFINCLLDGSNIASAGFLWGNSYVPNQGNILIPLRDLAVGTHTISVQQTNSYEYFTETIFSYSTSYSSWGTYYYSYYYNVYHYFVIPSSATKSFIVKPSPNFRRLQISRTNQLVTVQYTGIPTNNYNFQFSFDLKNWYLLGSGMTSTNGLVKFFDHYYPGYDGACFYRVYGP